MNFINRYKIALIGIVSSILLIFNVVMINLIVGIHPVSIDMTGNKLYSTGTTTLKILKKLKEDVVIYGLFDEGKIDENYKDVRDLLIKYQGSSKHIKVVYVDPDKNTKIIKQLDPEGVKDLKKNDFVVLSGQKSQKISYDDIFKIENDNTSLSKYKKGSIAEQAFTGAIKYVVSKTTPIIYFVEGQGEGNVNIQWKTLSDYLQKNNYVVKTVNLTSIGKIPDDAGLLFFTSPKSDLSYKESTLVDNYLEDGKNAVFLFDYSANDQNFENFDSIIKKYNISLNYDRVKENEDSSHIPGDPYSIIIDAVSNEVVSSDFQVLFGNSRSFNILKNNSNSIKVIPLVKTSGSSVGEITDNKKGKDIPGPLNLALATNRSVKTGNSKIFVAGNSSFISETTKQKYPQYFSSNMFIVLNTINWMQDIKDNEVIEVRNYGTNNLKISQSQSDIVGFVVIIVIPLNIFALGAFIFLKRRNR